MLNTFLDGLAELGIEKGLIKNKKLLSDLIEKGKGYRNAEEFIGFRGRRKKKRRVSGKLRPKT